MENNLHTILNMIEAQYMYQVWVHGSTLIINIWLLVFEDLKQGFLGVFFSHFKAHPMTNVH